MPGMYAENVASRFRNTENKAGGMIGLIDNPSFRADLSRTEASMLFSPSLNLGSGLVDHSQKMIVAARATAEKKAVGQRS